MSKITYPPEGLEPQIRTDAESCSNKLKLAINYCNFNLPYDFACRSWLSNLANTLQKEQNFYKSVIENAKKLDMEVSNLENQFRSNVESIECLKLSEQTTLIK